MSGDELADVLEHPDVTFELEVTGSSARWGVRELRIEEGLNQLSVCTLHARCDGHPTVRDLLYSDVRLTIERSTQQRYFKGIVQHARVREEVDGVEVELRVVPALWLLSQKIDTRIYQEMTAVQIVQDLYARTLSGTRRTVRNNTHATYHPREYTTQYQESCLAFLSRLTEEEGIFWYFDHEADDMETLVLADGTSGLPRVRESDQGRVPFWADPDQAPGHEAVSDIVHLEEIGAMDVVVSEYDWTRPSLSIQGRETGRSSREPALEVYDHTDAALLYGFNGQRYDGDTATVQARLRAESLDLGRHTWSMHSTVVTAQPGHLMQVTGAPEGDLDERYLITRVTTFGSATEGTRGTAHNTLDAVPTLFPYRPARRTRRPVVSGPETAFVVGPSGEEIHTDEHGRVRVHFHWDRVHDRTVENASSWLRVAHNWAGPGYGTFFLPRIGMEVVVSFLGGNPDRPLVTGCVYNGESLAGVELPAKKTQSVIRTKSSPHSDGYNEIRFEDAAGHEFISIHAQRNLLERVLHDHRTHVGHDQLNRVEENQEEHIGRDQTLEVVANRTHTVRGNERHTVRSNRTLEIVQHDDQTVRGTRSITVHQDEQTDVLGNRGVHVTGAQTTTVGSGVTATVTGGIQQTINSGGWTMSTTGNVTHGIAGGFVVDASQAVQLTSQADTTIRSTGPITLQSDAEVRVNAPSGIVQTSPAVRQNTSPSTMDVVGDWLIDGGHKFAMYYFALTIVTGLKIDIVAGGKIDIVAGFKVDNAKIKAKLNSLQLDNAAALWLRKQAVAILA